MDTEYDMYKNIASSAQTDITRALYELIVDIIDTKSTSYRMPMFSAEEEIYPFIEKHQPRIAKAYNDYMLTRLFRPIEIK